jgi:hypothetical protein
MAVENIKSTPITNRDAAPKVLNDSHVQAGILLEAVGICEAAAAATSASTYKFCQVPSNARISSVLLSSDDHGTTGLINVGIYKSTQDGGTVVDADFFASAVDIKTAALVDSNITHESGTYDIDDSEKPLWSALGLTSDPMITYDVVGQLTEASLSGGTMVIKVRYAI